MSWLSSPSKRVLTRPGSITPESDFEEWVSQDGYLAVVIPAHNVQDVISDVVAKIPAYVRYIILVDDASQDRTPQIADDLASDRIRVIHHPQNLGVGGAVLSGYQEALKLGVEIAVKIDGDGQMDPTCIPNLVHPILLGRANYTKGNRFLHFPELRTMPWIRLIGNIGLSFLTKLASGYWNIFDPTNGFTALDLTILPLLDLKRIDRRYFFETSMLIELGLQRAVVQDIYLPARYGLETSSLSEWQALREFPPKIFAGLLRRMLYNYFVRDFTAVSLFLIAGLVASLFGFLWGVYHWMNSIQQGVFASTGTVMVAVLPLIVGIQLLLQAIVMDVQNVPDQVIGK